MLDMDLYTIRIKENTPACHMIDSKFNFIG